MRSLVYDEISPKDMQKLSAHLAENLTASGLPEVFWLEVPAALLTPIQTEHGDCGPHRFALVLEADSLKLELLVRSSASLRCACTDYASQAQRAWLLDYADGLMTELELLT